MNLVAIADVILDTIHFNGMNTSLQAFAVGTPVVTLPTDLQRGRHTAGMYRRMGFTDCIARDPAHYATLALRVASDPEFRAHARQTILTTAGVLFEDMQVVREFERFFADAVGRA